MLYFSYRDELIYIKTGEESKTKEYEATCYITKGVFTDEFIEMFNNKGPIVLKQKTPLRVLHRRSLAVREKIIHSANILRVPGIYLYMTKIQKQCFIVCIAFF